MAPRFASGARRPCRCNRTGSRVSPSSSRKSEQSDQRLGVPALLDRAVELGQRPRHDLQALLLVGLGARVVEPGGEVDDRPSPPRSPGSCRSASAPSIPRRALPDLLARAPASRSRAATRPGRRACPPAARAATPPPPPRAAGAPGRRESSWATIATAPGVPDDLALARRAVRVAEHAPRGPSRCCPRRRSSSRSAPCAPIPVLTRTATASARPRRAAPRRTADPRRACAPSSASGRPLCP